MTKSTNRKFLTAAVMCSLLAMGSNSAWAAQQTTETVTSTTNTSKAENPYDSIAINSTGNPTYGIWLVGDGTEGMTVYVTGDKVLQVAAKPVSESVTVYGVSNEKDAALNIAGPLSGSVSAAGGTVDKRSESAYDNSDVVATAEAYGLNLNKGSLTVGPLKNLTVTATGGSAAAGTALSNGSNVYASGSASAYAFGLFNTESGKLQTGDIENLAVTAVSGTALGGTAKGSTEDNASASAYDESMACGLMNSGSLTASNIKGLKVVAIGGTATGGTATGGTIFAHAFANVNAYGLRNDQGTLTVGDLLGVELTAQGGTATLQQAGSPSTAEADAYGIYTQGGTVNVQGNLELKNISLKAGTVTDEKGVTTSGQVWGYSLYAKGTTSVINVGVDTTTGYPAGNGKSIKLIGDVAAVVGATNNVIFSGDSYLQGNILDKSPVFSETGTNNITFTNGATWQPVFDNRYGSFIQWKDSATLNSGYQVSDISTEANLTLSNGGIVDLTWDNATRSSDFRTLTIDTLKGNGGIFKVNTDLANNKADQIILGSASTSTSVGIDVAYDPYLDTSGLVAGNSINGKALVLVDNSKKMTTVTGISDSYNLYDYIPTITNNGDNTWSVTKVTIINQDPTPTPTPTPTPEPTPKQDVTSPSRPMRDTRNSRLALHNLWVNGELNNLTKRLGDLRAMEPAEAGIWARYEHNNLDQGDDVSLKYNMVQVGYDKAFAGTNGTTYRGAAMSYAKGTGDYEVSSGDVKETALSLYQTWVGKDGRYYDVILKGGKLMDNFDYNYGSNPFSADYNTWGYAVSGEFGKRLYHGNGVYVEPQVELTLGKINSTDCTTSTGMDVHMDGQNTALTRIGIAVGREIKNVGSYYFKASYYHDFGGGLNLTASDASTNPFSYSGDVAKNWCVFTLGGARKVGKSCNVFAEFSRFTGQLSNNLQYNVGARWKI
jgi:outer membrane autotransporter protein